MEGQYSQDVSLALMPGLLVTRIERQTDERADIRTDNQQRDDSTEACNDINIDQWKDR